jgi:hypothetical protein
VHLKSKSEFNISAAELLIDNDNYAPSVHCSYYGSFQYIKSKLNDIGYTYEEMDKTIGASKISPVKLSTHGYPLSLIYNELKTKVSDNGILAHKVKSNMSLLKTYRTVSDYHNEIVDYTKSKEALSLSVEIIKIVKEKL